MSHLLAGQLILIVEDEGIIAAKLHRMLTEAGGRVVGPVANVEDGLEVIASTPRLDLAVLDVALRDSEVFAVSRALIKRSVPFIFLTGYSSWALPERWRSYPIAAKPIVSDEL